jgi:hypothetical protein
MSVQTPVERVVKHLEVAGYRRLSGELKIASLCFAFPAVLISEGSDAELVVVADTASEDPPRIQKKIEGIARALDVIGSRRSITAIVAGPRPKNTVIDEISRVCRILPVGDAADEKLEDSLQNWLRVLTPLSIAEYSSQTSDPITRLELNLSSSQEEKMLGDLISASANGIEDVNKKIQMYLLATLKTVSDGE